MDLFLLKNTLSQKFPGLVCLYGRLKSKLTDRDIIELRQSYPDRVKELLKQMPEDEAMSVAVGGDYEFMGSHLVNVLKSYGLKSGDYLVEVGCGSGSVAYALSSSDMDMWTWWTWGRSGCFCSVLSKK